MTPARVDPRLREIVFAHNDIPAIDATGVPLSRRSGEARKWSCVQVLVCGGRDYKNAETLGRFWDQLAQLSTIHAMVVQRRWQLL